MSKPVRLPDYLHAEIERLAKAEKRSLANMVQVLLEQALQLPENFNKPKEAPPSSEKRVAIEVPADGTTATLPASPKKRLHPCRHHVPPSRVCQYCDV